MPTFPIDDLLTLHEPNGHEFDVVLVEVATSSPGGGAEGGSNPDVRLTFDTGWDTYDRAVEIFQLFHSAPDVRGDGPPDGFIEGKPVRVELRLASALAAEHFVGASAEDVARRLIALRDSDAGHALLETEAWYLASASQALDLPDDAPQGAQLREGFRTQWADAPTLGE